MAGEMKIYTFYYWQGNEYCKYEIKSNSFEWAETVFYALHAGTAIDKYTSSTMS